MAQASIFIVEDELIEAEDIRQTLDAQGYPVAGIPGSGESVPVPSAGNRFTGVQ